MERDHLLILLAVRMLAHAQQILHVLLAFDGLADGRQTRGELTQQPLLGNIEKTDGAARDQQRTIHVGNGFGVLASGSEGVAEPAQRIDQLHAATIGIFLGELQRLGESGFRGGVVRSTQLGVAEHR